MLLALALFWGTGCRTRPVAPRIAIGPLADGLEGFLAAHALPPGAQVRVDEVGRVAGASYHVVQLRGSETPHRHLAHDLTVHVLRGRGTLTREDDRLALGPGDTAVIPRGAVHWFAGAGDLAVAFAIFTPPLDAPDSVPAPTP